MAVVDFVRTEQSGHTYLHTWPTLLNGDTGEVVEIPGASDRTVQCDGNFSGSASVQLEGSMDGTNWSILTDLQDADIIFTVAGIKIVAEAPLFIRANVTAGDGSTDLNIRLLSSGGR